MITRRNFIAFFSGVTMSLFTSGHSKPQMPRLPLAQPTAKQVPTAATIKPATVLPPYVSPSTPAFIIRSDDPVVDNIARARAIVDPKTMPNIQLNGQQIQLLKSIMTRLTRLQNYYGYGNFNIIGFDRALNIARRQSSRGEVWVVPNLNFERIIKRSRGVHGDMNRKFHNISDNDPQLQAIKKIKQIITDDQVDMV
ncbi:MAG: hypothetical protein ACI8XC_004533 [Gammaproteobacteria bacterium]|jgi:hypothetical protein